MFGYKRREMRPRTLRNGICLSYLTVICVGVVGETALVAAPGAKEPASGPTMTEEQIRAALKEKGKITYGNGQYHLVGKVEGLDLIELEFREMSGEKVVYKLTSPQAGIVRVDAKAGTMRLLFDKVKIVRGDLEIEGNFQEYDLPAPRQTKQK